MTSAKRRVGVAPGPAANGDLRLIALGIPHPERHARAHRHEALAGAEVHFDGVGPRVPRAREVEFRLDHELHVAPAVGRDADAPLVVQEAGRDEHAARLGGIGEAVGQVRRAVLAGRPHALEDVGPDHRGRVVRDRDRHGGVGADVARRGLDERQRADDGRVGPGRGRDGAVLELEAGALPERLCQGRGVGAPVGEAAAAGPQQHPAGHGLRRRLRQQGPEPVGSAVGAPHRPPPSPSCAAIQRRPPIPGSRQ
jgi:hypothetical protein